MRMWEIREGYGHKDEVEEAYEEGCRDGWEKAMEEMGHRGGGYSQRGGSGYGNRYGRKEDWDDMDYMGERRRRDSRGRYV